MQTGERQVELALRALHEATASATGERYLEALVSAMGEVLGATWCAISLLLPGRCDRVRTHLVWHAGRFVEPFEYDLAGTPCQDVMDGGT